LKIRRNKRADVNTIQKNISHISNFSYNLSKRLIWIWKIIDFEAVIWIAGLFYLLLFHAPGQAQFTICPLYNLGIDFCPGCGIGNSISYLFNGEVISSFQTHPLGIFALIIITYRIITIIKNNWRRYA